MLHDMARDSVTYGDQPETINGPDLMRLGGLAAILGGWLMAIDVLSHLFVDDRLQPARLAGMAHEVWHVPGILALPLALMGLMAIYVRQARQSGRAGVLAFALLVFGITVGAIYSTIFHGLFMPAIEEVRGGLFETLVTSPTTAQFYRGVAVQGLGLGLGSIVFGVVTMKTGVFARGAGVLLIGAALFAAANQVFPPGQLISRLLFAAAFVWMGSSLWRRD